MPTNVTLTRCHLEVGNGNDYPNIHYTPEEDTSRVFHDVMIHVNAKNDLQGGTLLNISNYKELFPFIYFDLTKQKMDIKDGVTKLTFHYELSTVTDEIMLFTVLCSMKKKQKKKNKEENFC